MGAMFCGREWERTKPSQADDGGLFGGDNALGGGHGAYGGEYGCTSITIYTTQPRAALAEQNAADRHFASDAAPKPLESGDKSRVLEFGKRSTSTGND